jgi:hypothetical protein
VYVAAGNADFLVIDITDPTNPIVVSELLTGGAYDIFCSGNYAYLSNDLASSRSSISPIR